MGCASSSSASIVFYDLPGPQDNQQQQQQRTQRTQQVEGVVARPLFSHSEEYPDDEAYFWQVLWTAPPALDVALTFSGVSSHYAKRWVYFKELTETIAHMPGTLVVLCEQAECIANDIAKFERAPVLLQLAQTGFYLDLVYRFDKHLDVMMAAYTIPTLSGLQDMLAQERNARVDRLRAILNDDIKMEAMLFEEDFAFELLTLIKYNCEKFAGLLNADEKLLLEDAYAKIVSMSEMVLVALPDWFCPVDEILAHYNARRNDRGEPLCNTAVLREESFELVLRRTEMVSKLSRGNDIDLIAASHVGEYAYLHEPVFPEGGLAMLRLDKAPRWLYLWQIAQAIESLHDRGLAIGRLSWYHVDLTAHGRQLMLRSLRYCIPVPGPNSTKREHLIADGLKLSSAPEGPSTAWDVYCLGASIFELLCAAHFPPDTLESPSIEYGKPLPNQPSFIHVDEWQLIVRMCAPNADVRPTMQTVIRRLHTFMVKEDVELASPSRVLPTFTSVDEIDCSPIVDPIPQILNTTAAFVNAQIPTVINRSRLSVHLFTRYLHLYEQVKASNSIPKRAGDRLGQLMPGLYGLMASCTDPNSSVITDLVVFLAQKELYLDLHRGLDICLAEFGVSQADLLWHWRAEWKRGLDEYYNLIFNQLEQKWPIIAAEFTQSADNEVEGTEEVIVTVLSILQFELTKRQYRYQGRDLELIEKMATFCSNLALSEAMRTIVRRDWFIPAYELLTAPAVFTGQPNQIVRGKWRGRPVLVSMSLAEAQNEVIKQYIEQMHAVSHPNVRRIIGGSDIGKQGRYIVQIPHSKVLVDLTQGKDEPFQWKYLLDIAQGISALHDAGIAAGTLSASTIAISDLGEAQVTTVIATNVRWAAPELLESGSMTIYSDIFALGMLILEVLSGDVPWGSNMSDEYVEYQARQGNLPPMPRNMVKDDWALIRRLCAKDPTKRVGLSVAIAAAINAERNTTYTIESGVPTGGAV